MTPLLPQLVVLTTGVGVLMILLGLGQGLLDARSGSRRSPSCGRTALIEGATAPVLR